MYNRWGGVSGLSFALTRCSLQYTAKARTHEGEKDRHDLDENAIAAATVLQEFNSSPHSESYWIGAHSQECAAFQKYTISHMLSAKPS